MLRSVAQSAAPGSVQSRRSREIIKQTLDELKFQVQLSVSAGLEWCINAESDKGVDAGNNERGNVKLL